MGGGGAPFGPSLPIRPAKSAVTHAGRKGTGVGEVLAAAQPERSKGPIRPHLRRRIRGESADRKNKKPDTETALRSCPGGAVWPEEAQAERRAHCPSVAVGALAYLQGHRAGTQPHCPWVLSLGTTGAREQQRVSRGLAAQSGSSLQAVRRRVVCACAAPGFPTAFCTCGWCGGGFCRAKPVSPQQTTRLGPCGNSPGPGEVVDVPNSLLGQWELCVGL